LSKQSGWNHYILLETGTDIGAWIQLDSTGRTLRVPVFLKLKSHSLDVDLESRTTLLHLPSVGTQETCKLGSEVKTIEVLKGM